MKTTIIWLLAIETQGYGSVNPV